MHSCLATGGGGGGGGGGGLKWNVVILKVSFEMKSLGAWVSANHPKLYSQFHQTVVYCVTHHYLGVTSCCGGTSCYC